MRCTGGIITRLLVLLVVFVAGLFAGSFATGRAKILYLKLIVHQPEVLPDQVTAVLDHRLGLSDEQAEQVRAIVRQRVEWYRAVEPWMVSALNFQMDGFDRDMKQVLTAEQRQEWDAMFKRMRDTWTPRVERPR